MSTPPVTTGEKSTMAACMSSTQPRKASEVTTITVTYPPRPRLRLLSMPRDICTLNTRDILSSAKTNHTKKIIIVFFLVNLLL